LYQELYQEIPLYKERAVLIALKGILDLCSSSSVLDSKGISQDQGQKPAQVKSLVDDSLEKGELVPSRTSKRSGGKPTKSQRAQDLMKLDPSGVALKAKERLQLVSRIKGRQVEDCKSLSLKLSAKLKSRDPMNPDDLGKLTRAVKGLHDLERDAYGLGAKDSQAQKVIVMPVRPDDMKAWQAGANRHLPTVVPPVDVTNRCLVIEDDIQGEAPPVPSAGDTEDQEGAA